ncbi:MAG: hypothetical protein ACLFSZ_03960, partial [Puniceicoccaceae bacterium]
KNSTNLSIINLFKGQHTSSPPEADAAHDLISTETRSMNHEIQIEGLSFNLVLSLFFIISLICLVAAFIRNKKIFSLLLLLILACGCGIFFYFFSPAKIAINRVDEYHSFRSNELPLVSSLGINIRGKIDGDAIVRFSRNLNDRGLVFELKEGAIEIDQGSDWYSDSCYIFYEPIDAKVGEVIIEYTLGTPFN